MNSVPVSVIIPFLNAEKFLGEAVDSVLRQTYGDWELLFVDDGSSDGSTELALDYVKKYPDRVRYFEHEGHRNQGAWRSRNLGIMKSRGEYLAFFDADDVMLPGKLERETDIIEQHSDVGVIVNRRLFWHKDGKVTSNPMPTMSSGKYRAGEWALKILENDSNGAIPGSVLMRRNLAVSVGGFEEGLQNFHDDVRMWYKLSLNSPVYYDPEPVVLYRQHSSSIWGRALHNELILAWIHFYGWLLKYLTYYNGRFPLVECSAKLNYYRWLMRYLVEMEQFEGAAAVRNFTEAMLPSLETDAEWNYLAGFCMHVMKSDLGEALRRYDIAMDKGFNEFWVRYNRGALHAQMGNVEQARADLLRAVELDPSHEGARQTFSLLPREKKEK